MSILAKSIFIWDLGQPLELMECGELKLSKRSRFMPHWPGRDEVGGPFIDEVTDNGASNLVTRSEAATEEARSLRLSGSR